MRKLELSFVNAQDLRKILSPMRNICARFVHDCTSFSNAQYMRKVCAKLYLFPQCAIFVKDLHKIVLLSPMHNICAIFYHHLCTKYDSAGHKIFYFLIQIDRSNYIQ